MAINTENMASLDKLSEVLDWEPNMIVNYIYNTYNINFLENNKNRFIQKKIHEKCLEIVNWKNNYERPMKKLHAQLILSSLLKHNNNIIFCDHLESLLTETHEQFRDEEYLDLEMSIHILETIGKFLLL